RLTSDDGSEWQGTVSPDGKWVAFVSDRETEGDDTDLWVRELPAAGAAAGTARLIRVTRVTGLEAFPSWAPDSLRLAYFARRGAQNAVWVSTVPSSSAGSGENAPGGRGGAGRGVGPAGRGGGPGAAALTDAAIVAS